MGVGNDKTMRKAECDYYELDENANAQEVIDAIQQRMLYKDKNKKIEKKKTKKKSNDKKEEADNALALEWKLEQIKNKHLAKHFDANYEGVTFGFHDMSKQSEDARYIALEQNDFQKDDIDCFRDSNQLQTYYENLAVNKGEEIEYDDEGYHDKEYPDEWELSDYYTKDDEDVYEQTASDVDSLFLINCLQIPYAKLQSNPRPI